MLQTSAMSIPDDSNKSKLFENKFINLLKPKIIQISKT
jgi:hypothetical protein